LAPNLQAATLRHGNTRHGNTRHGNTRHGNTRHGNTTYLQPPPVHAPSALAQCKRRLASERPERLTWHIAGKPTPASSPHKLVHAHEQARGMHKKPEEFTRAPSRDWFHGRDNMCLEDRALFRVAGFQARLVPCVHRQSTQAFSPTEALRQRSKQQQSSRNVRE
jgi:hypothetical protein